MADGTLIMAPGASMPGADSAVAPVATLHTGGVLSTAATHIMPASHSRPTGQIGVPAVANASGTASLAPAASTSMNATQLIGKGQMVQGIMNGEYEWLSVTGDCPRKRPAAAAPRRSHIP